MSLYVVRIVLQYTRLLVFHRHRRVVIVLMRWRARRCVRIDA